jgi:hypothetical protein
MVTGRIGQFCAAAGVKASKRATMAKIRFFIMPPFLLGADEPLGCFLE